MTDSKIQELILERLPVGSSSIAPDRLCQELSIELFLAEDDLVDPQQIRRNLDALAAGHEIGWVDGFNQVERLSPAESARRRQVEADRARAHEAAK